MIKGSHHDSGSLVKMSESKKLLKQIPWNKGKTLSKEIREKLSAAKRGKPGHPQAPETRAKIANGLRGIKRSEETRAKISGPNCRTWKGGRRLCSRGYVKRLVRNHPFADDLGYVYEHRLVMEAHLGRTLLPTEVVHHINGNPADNRIENLLLFSSQGKHANHHLTSGKE